MNKRLFALAGMAFLLLAAAGCGKTSERKPAISMETPSPTPEPVVTEAPAGTLVYMEKVEEPGEYSDVENYIGEKTDSASFVLVFNQTGDPIEHIFIRAAARDDGSSDEWGEELIHSFAWEDQESALYYYENNQKDLEGNTATSYDIRISYEDVNKSELYYRNLPLPLIKELRLCVDISGDFGLPYARYITISGNREFSTLQEVRAWYGLDVEEDDYDDDYDTETSVYDTESESESELVTEASPTPAPEATGEETTTVTPAPDETTTEQTTEAATELQTEATTTATTEATYTEDSYDEPDQYASQASGYIGSSLGSLMGAMGSPTASEYEDEPGVGRMGYHYYGTFTVATSVDENGNETITGIW